MKITKIIISILCLTFAVGIQAQNFNWISSTEEKHWQQKNTKLHSKTNGIPDVETGSLIGMPTFKSWGTCLNELGWDALNMLPREKQEKIMSNIYSPIGDLKFTMARFTMNANDYSRDWYSCDEVSGDFQLKYFNIDRDKTTLIPFIKFAQQYNPDITFWVSPWSPPSWMKINHYYSVRSDNKYNQMSPLSDVALFEDSQERNDKVFPKQLAVNDYFIQDPRYLTSYANYFCKFISAYKEQGIPISMVMYQNEAYSYTNYPGCAWTSEGTIRFNVEYLAPALKQQHPEVKLYMGTINTNRYEVVDQILSDPRMSTTVKGVGFQWEGREILPRIRAKYPQYKYVQTESECGWGSFDWKAAEHTFNIMNDYLCNGCEEYTFWNIILADKGTSGWGWNQNALIRVDSHQKTATYTPEYYAVKHYAHFIPSGSQVVAFKKSGTDKKPMIVFRNPKGEHVIIAGNFQDKEQPLNVKIEAKYLIATLQPHSLNTFISK
jgi:glucosylceramidase